MDARGESNGGDGRDGRIPPDQEGPRFGRGQGAGRASAGGSDPLMMAVPRGVGESKLVGAETGSATPDGFETPDVFRSRSEPRPLANAPERCKFLRSIGPDGKLFDPGQEAVSTHRCAAYGDPLPLSLRQQELVCLQRVHVSCPRYMRGTLLAEASATAAKTQPAAGLPRLTLAGLALVALAGLALAAAMAGWLPGTGGAAPSGAPSAVVGATSGPTPAATRTLAPTASSSASPTTSPSASPEPTVTPEPTPSAASSSSTGATKSRMDRVVPCTDQANCYVYTIGLGDRVAFIADYFGVDLAKVREMNPWLGKDDTIHPGDKLKIPPPTR